MSSTSGIEPERQDWGHRLLWIGGGLLFVLVLGFIASATVPRWWAQRVGEQVEGSITTGIFVGLFYGFIFTLLPLAVLLAVAIWRRTWRAVAVALAFAVLLAVPNLMTLGIVLGRGNAAHAGERILDVEAPAFRGGSLAGTLIAVGLVAYVIYLRGSRRSAKKRAREARDELEASRFPPEEPPTVS